MKTLSFCVQNIAQLQHEFNLKSVKSDACHLIQIFSSQSCEEVKVYHDLLIQYYPNAEIIGVSVIHSNINAVIYSQSTVISISSFESSQITIASVCQNASVVTVGNQLWQSLSISDTSKSVIAFASQDSHSSLFDAFSNSSICVPISGGIAVDAGHDAWVLLNGQFYHDHIVAVALHGDNLQVWRKAFIEWNPIGRCFRITSSQGQVVKSINSILAYDFYCQYLSDSKSISLDKIKMFPLISKEDNSVIINSVESITDEGYLVFALNVAPGDQVRFAYNHPSLTQEQVNQAIIELAEKKPESIFIYNCESRIENSSESTELQGFSYIAPCQGMYSNGEFFRSRKQKILHHSLTYLALSESNDSNRADINLPAVFKENNLTPLFSLVKNSIKDLDSLILEMEQKVSEQSIRLLETYRTDRITGLANHSVLKERLSNMSCDNYHLVLFKLTNLSQVNEKYGYRVGDNFLRDITTYMVSDLSNKLGVEITLYSIGTAEWGAVFLSDQPGDILRENITRFIFGIEHKNFELHDGYIDYLTVTMSGGVISRRDFTDISVEDLILKATESRRIAMSRNKSVCNAYDLTANELSSQSQLEWITSVNEAIKSQDVLVYGQPIFCAETNRQVSTECLVRIRKDGQIIAPGQFLPAVEGTHIYTRLSRKMISRTFDLMRNNDLYFSINLSPQDLMSDTTLELLNRSILSLDKPARVGLEILETEQIRNYQHILDVCNHFRSLGARIIVDDFGSGYSNIDEIMKLEPQIIKLDGSIIKNIHENKRQRIIAEHMVRLSHSLDAKVVAEFVHNAEVCNIAKAIGVDYLQGYFLAEPMSLEVSR